MQHAIRYEGGFERNFAALRPGNTDFVGEGNDDRRYPAAIWHKDADGLRFSFMEKRGKKFVVVRVQYGPTDIVLPHEVAIDQTLHLGGRHLGPEPLLLRDTEAGALLGDIMKANRERFTELSALRDQVRHGLGPHGQRSEGPRPTP
jgi:hypothetical protein